MRNSEDFDFIERMPDDLCALLGAAGVTIVTARSRGVDAWLGANNVRSALIRPDSYVFATPNSHDELAMAGSSLARTLGLEPV